MYKLIKKPVIGPPNKKSLHLLIKQLYQCYYLGQDSSPDGATYMKAELKSVCFTDIRITVGRFREKLYDIVIDNLKLNVDDEDMVTFFSAKHKYAGSYFFNLPMGGFIRKEIRGAFDFRYEVKRLKQLQFDNIDIKIGDHPFIQWQIRPGRPRPAILT